MGVKGLCRIECLGVKFRFSSFFVSEVMRKSFLLLSGSRPLPSTVVRIIAHRFHCTVSKGNQAEARTQEALWGTP